MPKCFVTNLLESRGQLIHVLQFQHPENACSPIRSSPSESSTSTNDRMSSKHDDGFVFCADGDPKKHYNLSILKAVTISAAG
jgi:hypothetical protein